MEGSTFHLAQLESRGADTVIVHLGGLIGAHGPPHVGEGLMSDRVGYPFPP